MVACVSLVAGQLVEIVCLMHATRSVKLREGMLVECAGIFFFVFWRGNGTFNFETLTFDDFRLSLWIFEGMYS